MNMAPMKKRTKAKSTTMLKLCFSVFMLLLPQTYEI